MLTDADRNLEYKSVTKDRTLRLPDLLFDLRFTSAELIDGYLNGGRTLSNQRLSYLVVSSATAGLPTPPLTPQPHSPAEDTSVSNPNYDLLICAAHFLGDGMALHQFANDFFSLLAADKSLQELEAQLNEEWERHCRPGPGKVHAFDIWAPLELTSFRIDPHPSDFRRR